MKTKTFILLSLLICNLLPAQNVKLDIKPHFLGVRADSLFVSMDISVEIEDMNPKNAVILTPILTGQDRKILLPAIQLNGKQKQKLYVRNQILRKKKNSKESNTAYLVTQKFNGFFWGGYLNGAQFNVGGKKLPFGIFADLKKYRYEGWLIGGGISCGYHWMLNDHWNVETSLGVGYDFIRYKQYNCVRKCAGLRNKGQYHYIGPSKASVSLVYLF